MNSLPTIRASSTPHTSHERRLLLINRYLTNYEQNKPFMAGLCRIADAYGGALVDWNEQYFPYNVQWQVIRVDAARGNLDKSLESCASAIVELVTTYALHLLPEDLGYDAVLTECYWSAIEDRKPEHITADRIATYTIRVPPHVKGIVPNSPGITFPFTFSGTWNARHETPADAEKRLIAEFSEHIRAELHRKRQQMHDAGYDYDDAFMTDVYLRWLYRRVTLRESVQDIALTEHVKPATVETITKKYARAIGVSRIPDNRYSQRGKR